MRMLVRLTISLLAALCGATLGFGAVALVFALLRQDAGIGGGLLALLAALIGAAVGAITTFRQLGTRAES